MKTRGEEDSVCSNWSSVLGEEGECMSMSSYSEYVEVALKNKTTD